MNCPFLRKCSSYWFQAPVWMVPHQLRITAQYLSSVCERNIENFIRIGHAFKSTRCRQFKRPFLFNRCKWNYAQFDCLEISSSITSERIFDEPKFTLRPEKRAENERSYALNLSQTLVNCLMLLSKKNKTLLNHPNTAYRPRISSIRTLLHVYQT